jgi:hypothetical protein
VWAEKMADYKLSPASAYNPSMSSLKYSAKGLLLLIFGIGLFLLASDYIANPNLIVATILYTVEFLSVVMGSIFALSGLNEGLENRKKSKLTNPDRLGTFVGGAIILLLILGFLFLVLVMMGFFSDSLIL